MDKFGRNYVLKVSTREGGVLTITLPFTIEVDVTRNNLSSANVCQVRVFNLSLKNRNQIRFNVYDFNTFQSIELFAGYGANPPRIFSGNITQAWSVREGTNFITQIECFGGGFAFANAITNMTFPPNTPQRDVIKSVMKDLPHTKVGAVGNYPGATGRSNSYSGSTTDILTQNTGGGFFIDNGFANALGTSEYIAAPGALLIVDAQSGLLGTPVLENNIVRFEMLFEPGLNVGSLISLKSGTEASFNGTYKVTGVKHRGMISETVCGSFTTTGEFLKVKQGTPVPLELQ